MIEGWTEIGGLHLQVGGGEVQVWEVNNPQERWTEFITEETVSHFRFLAMLAEANLPNGDVTHAGFSGTPVEDRAGSPDAAVDDGQDPSGIGRLGIPGRKRFM